jgi:hypothetical protein
MARSGSRLSALKAQASAGPLGTHAGSRSKEKKRSNDITVSASGKIQMTTVLNIVHVAPIAPLLAP